MPAGSTDTFTVITFNFRGIKGISEELIHFINSVKPDVLALQENFLTKSTYIFRLPGYTCIESKANLIKGGKGLLLAARNKSGLQISELQSCQAWLSGIIYGGKINGKKFESIVTNVHMPST
ncbi:hypothetical protein AYI70_g370 [Smittium culicis]|uniref:Endonuclease/exonuclease/phosphatase domain-containing protein n=1 Tax=Smittium culicis TaxID=133412 RepID=A0A1R1YGX9_9FUNG|nr:hypothetical protein AYI70_g370 [Smittium culicis]